MTSKDILTADMDVQRLAVENLVFEELAEYSGALCDGTASSVSTPLSAATSACLACLS